MKIKTHKGFTLVELSIVIALILALASTLVFLGNGFIDSNHGRRISANLRQVFLYQKELVFTVDGDIAKLNFANNKQAVAKLAFPSSSLSEAESLFENTYSYTYNKEKYYMIISPNLQDKPIYSTERNLNWDGSLSPIPRGMLIDNSGRDNDGLFDTGLD